MTVSEIIVKMIKQSNGNLHDICHFMKVYAYAKTIAECEKITPEEQKTVEIAAVIHDIACPLCREKYGNTNGKLQEKEGMILAREFLKEGGLPDQMTERIIFLVGHHHTLQEGEVYERNIFTAKDKLFKQDNFVDEVKHFYTDLINLLVKDDKEKLHVFDSSGLYLATKKIGKNNPKAEQIQIDNEMRMRWNCEVDRAIVSGVPETEIQQIKKKYITDRIRESVDIFGRKPERLGSIIMTAVMALALLISKVLDKARELSARFFETEMLQSIAEPSEGRMTEIIPQTDKAQMQEKINHREPTANPSAPKRDLQPKTQVQATEQETPQIPPKPVMSAEAAAYPKLLKIYKELNRQNGIIFDAERERNALELERDNLKGKAYTNGYGIIKGKIQTNI